MVTGMQAWVVAWVVCLAGHAHSQLGVKVVGGGTAGVGDTPTTTTTSTSTTTSTTTTTTTATPDQLMPGKHEEKGGREGPEVLADPWRWRPLEETYQGCFKEESFNGTLMFVNLTEVMELQQMKSVEEACFHMCEVKEPFSLYIAVSPAVSGGGDGCGCKDYLDFNDEVDRDGCDTVLEHYRAYCGPSNLDCINRAGQITMTSISLILPLLTLFLSYISLNGA